MVGKIVVTYKRKKLSSRINQSHDVSSDQHENSITKTRLQETDKEHAELIEDKGSSSATGEVITLKQGDNLYKDHCSNFRDDPSYKQRLALPLITFTRRCKRKKDADASSSVNLKDNGAPNLPISFVGNQEKNSSEDIDSSLVSGPDAATSRIIGTDNLSQSVLHGTAEEARSVSEKIIQGCLVLTSSVEADTNRSDVSSVTKETPSNVSASRGIDCNLPPESDENTLILDLEDASGSSNMVPEKSPPLQMQEAENRSSTKPFVDKGKSVMDCPQVTCLQLFPLSRSGENLQTTNNPQNYFPVRPPNVPVRSREPLQDFIPYTLPNSRSSFLDGLARPRSAWSEDELDCLWIGVRRHGLGNWDAILRDQRLPFFFLPWRTASDLAERWLEEQSQLVRGLPPSSLFKGLGDSYQRYGYGVNRNNQSLSPSNFINDRMNPGTYIPYNYLGKEINLNPYDTCRAVPVMESLPHWLREANEIPSRLNEPNRYPQPWMGNGFGSAHCVSGSNVGVKVHCTSTPLVMRRGETKPNERLVDKQRDLVIVSSDSSSEETVSDDRSVRP